MKSTGCKVVAPSIADAIINRTEAKIAEKDEKEEMFLFWKKMENLIVKVGNKDFLVERNFFNQMIR